MNNETIAKLKDAIQLAIEEIQHSSVETFICADKAPFDASIIIHIDRDLITTVEYRVGVIPQSWEEVGLRESNKRSGNSRC